MKFIALILFLAGFLHVNAIEHSDSVPTSVVQDTLPKRPGLFTRIMNYFGDANKEKPEKKFDVNFIGGPFYSSDLKLGLGVVGAGLYRMNGCEKDMQPSNVSLSCSASIVGFYMIGVQGNNLFPGDRYRLNYTLSFYSFPSYFWGIGYNRGNNDANKTKIDRIQANVKAEFMFKLGEDFYLGPTIVWDYARAKDVNSDYVYLFDGMSMVQRNYGAGVSMQYDTRDFINNASRGVYVYASQMFRPEWLGNDMPFSTTEFQLRGYKKVWRGGVLAGEIRGQFNFGNPSWAMMAELGGSNSMRGYYEGRYRDKHSMSAQVELRQHVWRRSGVTVWVGAGNVFHNSSTFKKVLPNYGIGYRWEFKKRVNVRLDLGFGKSGQMGFIFNINEAF